MEFSFWMCKLARMNPRICVAAALIGLALAGRVLAQNQVPAPTLSVERVAGAALRLSWPAAGEYLLEEASPLDGIGWEQSWVQPVLAGNSLSVTVEATGTERYFRLRSVAGTLTTIAMTSPVEAEDGVTVTRPARIQFTAPLAANTALNLNQFYAEATGRRILARVQLSADRRIATLFFLENLPAAARVRVSFDSGNVRDIFGRPVDGDGDGAPGGMAIFEYNTFGATAIPGTAVIGRVFASELTAGSDTGTNAVNRPLQGVTITVDGQEETLRTTTDEFGNFILDPAPAGRFFVHVDGRTAGASQWPNGAYYPVVGKAWEAVAGVKTNFAGGDGFIYLPLISGDTLQTVSAIENTTITFPNAVIERNPALAGVSITVPPNAVLNDNGMRGGRVGIAPVPPDRLPEKLPPGLNFPLVITVQTDGASNFDAPVPVRFPNLPDPTTGIMLPPGAKSALWSFDHHLGEWEVVGTMTVSADGRFVESDPGVGIVQPGWHGTQPGGNNRCDRPRPRPGPPPPNPPWPPGPGPGPGPGGGPPSSGGGSGGPFDEGGNEGSGNVDTDGDGTPDSVDDDIDGDGIPNEVDGDIDGDGRPNPDDPDDDGDTIRDNSDTIPEGGSDCGGIECGCDLTGAYQDPAAAIAPAGANGLSPDGRYRLNAAASPNGGFSVNVQRAAGQNVLSLNEPAGIVSWGFARAGDGFVSYRLTGGAGNQSLVVALFNLARPDPSRPVFTVGSSPGIVSSFVGFSPGGNYLLIASSRGQSQITLQVVSVANGDVKVSTTFNTTPVPIDGGGSGSWGFSTECAERSFVYAYLPQLNQIQWNVVNLLTATPGSSPTISASFSSIGGYWKFSPCGDMVILVTQPNTQQVFYHFYRTWDGSTPNGGTGSLTQIGLDFAFKTTLADHVLVNNGDNPVFPNIADDPCTGPQPQSLRATAVSPQPLYPPEEPPAFSTGLHYYAVWDASRNEITQRGQAGSLGVVHANILLPPRQLFRNYVLRAATLEVGWVDFLSAENGRTAPLPDIILLPDDSADGDGDLLPDIAEFIMGTDSADPDTDNDGVPDGVEVRNGTNPSDGLAVATGVIAAADTPGNAVDIAALNDLVAVADSEAGIALFNVFSGMSPVLVAQVDTPGRARRVSISARHAAVADDTAGLAIIDIADPANARITQQVPTQGAAQAVVIAGSYAYVGTAGGRLMVVNLVDGAVIDRVRLMGEAHDLAVEGQYLYCLLQDQLRVYQFYPDGGLEFLGASPRPSFFAGTLDRLRRLFVGGARAYVTSYPGYDVFDVSNPLAIRRLGAARDTTVNSFKQIVLNGSGLGIAAVGPVPSEAPTHDVALYDTSNPEETGMFLANFTTPGATFAVTLNNALAYAADGRSGLQVINYRAREVGEQAPTIQLRASFPLNPAQVDENTEAVLIADAMDDVQVRNVEFYLDGARALTDGNFPFEFRFTAPGVTPSRTAITLRAKAIDTAGNETWSPEIQVALTRDRTGPRVRRFEPSNDQILGSVTRISAQMTEALDPTTVTRAAFTLIEAGPDRVIGTSDDRTVTDGSASYTDGSRMAALTLPNDLTPGLYEIELAAVPRDLAGNIMTAPARSRFFVIQGPDLDQDGVRDDIEATLGLDPANPDSNNNGLLDGEEDTDRDGLSNGLELVLGTDPNKPDTDDDGIPDIDEDTDNDVLSDYRELLLGTSPTVGDTDSDGWPDEPELTANSNPRDAASTPKLILPATPAVEIVLPDLGIGDGFRPNTVVANPPLEIVLPNLGTVDLPRNTVIATPPLEITLPALGLSEGQRANTTIAHPPVRIERN
jgi:hypothetical protein